MNLLVFVKRVPDTESKIKIGPDGRSIVEDGLNFIISPYDEYAMEEALRIRDARGGKVTAVTVGGEASLVILRKCLAMGADEAVLVKDPLPETYDGLRTARIIARLVTARFPDFELLLFGKQSVGADNSQVPSMTAELLGIAQANVVVKLEVEGDRATAWREIEGGQEKVALTLPAVISAQKGLNEPRYETLKGIMMAKKKPVPTISLEELGIPAQEAAPGVSVVRLEPPPSRAAGRVVTGIPGDVARQLAEFLHGDAKII
jgi:electron transfer flavoprotein beta subunit